MGTVYRARDLQAQREVALKVLLGAGQVPEERFRREGEIAARLDHPGIVRVYSSGVAAGKPWLAYELVTGARPLDAALAERDLRGRVELFLATAEALGHAHAQGVVHRDVKPDNVLVDGEGRVRVADFGLALGLDSERLTKTGAIVGTPYYMAPEQIKSPKDVDTRVDVFALGVMLYELMTGQRPFQGQTAGEVTHKIINTEPLKPTAVNEKLRPAFDAIVLKAIEKDAEVRYQSVDELRREVAKYRRGDRVRGAGDVDQLKATVRRYWAANMGPLLIGFFVASALYLPWIYLLLG